MKRKGVALQAAQAHSEGGRGQKKKRRSEKALDALRNILGGKKKKKKRKEKTRDGGGPDSMNPEDQATHRPRLSAAEEGGSSEEEEKLLPPLKRKSDWAEGSVLADRADRAAAERARWQRRPRTAKVLTYYWHSLVQSGTLRPAG